MHWINCLTPKFLYGCILQCMHSLITFLPKKEVARSFESTDLLVWWKTSVGSCLRCFLVYWKSCEWDGVFFSEWICERETSLRCNVNGKQGGGFEEKEERVADFMSIGPWRDWSHLSVSTCQAYISSSD